MAGIFPRGIATGRAFYDRTRERSHLKKNIEHIVHTVLIAPRRFGKTSLMSQVLFESDYHSIWLDFMTITSREDVQLKLIEKIQDVLVKLAPLEERLKKLISKYFRKLHPELVLSMPGISVKLNPSSEPHRGITEALLELDKLVAETGNKLVIVLDEFQEILRIDPNSTVLQASIRHAAERATAITYVFSGSKHRPLRKLFNGKENPLYELCDQMTLERVSPKDYAAFINKEAEKKWGYALNNQIIEKILTYTDCYPKYVNALCGSLWQSELEPSLELVDKLWRSYLFSRKTDIVEELGGLTLNQKRLLQHLALHPTETPYGKHYLSLLNMSQSSVQTALEIILDKGLVVKLEGLYRVLDPTLRAYFDVF